MQCMHACFAQTAYASAFVNAGDLLPPSVLPMGCWTMAISNQWQCDSIVIKARANAGLQVTCKYWLIACLVKALQ